MKRYRMLLAPLLALALPLSALADAPESTAQIQTDLRDGQAPGSITPQVMRNFAVSVFDPFPAVISAAGTTQGTATVLTSQFNIITTCASGAGVMATSYYTKVWNATSNACLVYPITGAQFNSNGTNSPISVPAGGAAEFIMSTTTQGYWHSASCAQGTGYVDGCAGAPGGVAQFPAILSSYTKRPPWNVAGVDYAVGLPSGVTLQDPTTATLPSGCSHTTTVVTCTGNNITVSGYDFSLHGGIQLVMNGNGGWTITQNNFGMSTTCVDPVIRIIGMTSNSTITQNTIDGGSGTCNGVGNFGGMIFGTFNAGTTMTITYNWLKNIWQDGIDAGGPSSGNAALSLKYNLFDTEGWAGHPDGTQFNGGNWPGSFVSYNTYRQTSTPTAASGTQPFHTEAQLTSAITSHTTDHNTIVVPGTNSAASQDAGNGRSQQIANYLIACKQDSGSNTNTGFSAYGNYVDATGAVLPLTNGYACTSTTWGSPLANVDMVTGANLTTTP